MSKVTLPEKPRKHRWVTEALANGDSVVRVWPSPDDLKSAKKRHRFMEVVAKVGNDPRVLEVTKMKDDVCGLVFSFYLNDA